MRSDRTITARRIPSLSALGALLPLVAGALTTASRVRPPFLAAQPKQATPVLTDQV